MPKMPHKVRRKERLPCSRRKGTGKTLDQGTTLRSHEAGLGGQESQAA